MKIPVFTCLSRNSDEPLAVLRSIYTPDRRNVGLCIVCLRADGEVAAPGDPVAAVFKTDNPTAEDRAVAERVAKILGVPDGSKWYTNGTVVLHPLDAEMSARLLPLMAEEQRLAAQLREAQDRLNAEREKIEGLRFVEVP